MSRKTKLEIFNETVEYYSTNPAKKRGKGSLGCQYLTDEGQMCAVGRCCVDPSPDWIGGCDSIRSAKDMRNFIELEDLLKPEYRGHTIRFWQDLQSFHDSSEHFTAKGLTEKGLAWIKLMEMRIIENRYDV